MNSKDCPFCARHALEDRVFYDDRGHQQDRVPRWFAFLAAPYHVRGHTILAAQKRWEDCPVTFDEAGVSTIGPALLDVECALREHYGTEETFFASARADVGHFHVHLFPRWPGEEKPWRKDTFYETGHILEFLGFIEKRGDTLALEERIDKGWDNDRQRKHITRDLFNDVEALRQRASYKGAWGGSSAPGEGSPSQPVVVTPEIAGAWIGPSGFHLRAKQYLEAADALPRGPEYNPVPYFLYCHAIELALKAFLRLKGENLKWLKKRIGHHLPRALARARKHSLDQLYTVSPAQVGELAKAHTYYNGKSFEYFDLLGMFHAYKDLPNLDVLRSLARELVTKLERSCYEAMQSTPPP